MPSASLEGVLVLSLEQAVAAPYCSARLADAGARVIKVERREGDFARAYDTALGEVSSYFAWVNRGKQSLVADIKHAADAQLLHRIVGSADIFIQGLAPGVAARAGFGTAMLRRRHKRLITVDISGYGMAPAWSGKKAYDLLIQAETGLAGLTGHAAGPGRVGVSVSDIACGMNAHAAVLEALIERARTGRGTGIAVSLFDSIADWMNVPLLYYEGTGKVPPRLGLAHPSLAPYGAFATRDGRLILISIQNEREWARLCTIVLARPDLVGAPGYESNAARVANRAEVDALASAAFAALPADQAADKMEAAGIAFGFVNDLDGLRAHPALRRIPVALPGGAVDLVAPAALFDGVQPDLRPVPALDKHGPAIRAEFAAPGEGRTH
jgi:itaconate CoA-transferase